MTDRYREHLISLAEQGDKNAIETLKRAGIDGDYEVTTIDVPVSYDATIPRKPLDKYVNKQMTPDWKPYKR